MCGASRGGQRPSATAHGLCSRPFGIMELGDQQLDGWMPFDEHGRPQFFRPPQYVLDCFQLVCADDADFSSVLECIACAWQSAFNLCVLVRDL